MPAASPANVCQPSLSVLLADEGIPPLRKHQSTQRPPIHLSCGSRRDRGAAALTVLISSFQKALHSLFTGEDTRRRGWIHDCLDAMTAPRSSLHAVDTSQPSQVANVFSDEYATEEVDEGDVADGFDRTRAMGHDRIEGLSRQSSMAPQHNRLTSGSRSRNIRSIDKSALGGTSPEARHSFSLRHDGQAGSSNGRSGHHGTNPTPTTANPFGDANSAHARPPSPLRAGTGPSFPYASYPQQNTIPDFESPHHLAPSAIPVGFSDQRDVYQRRIGPEGEDIADMIGPYGHTEPLVRTHTLRLWKSKLTCR